MKKLSSIFEYEWSKAKTVEEATFLLNRGACAIILGDNTENLENIRGISLSEEDVVNLGITTNKSPKLRAICLSGCNLTERSTKLFIETLDPESLIESIVLSNNDIGVQGAEAISKFLEKNSSLKHLDLCNCGLGFAGISQLLDALEANESIRSLLLDDNEDMSTACVIPLFEHLKSRKNLVNLSVLNSFCDIRRSAELFSFLKKNQNILFVGFPTFYSSKKVTSLIFNTSTDSMDSTFSRDDLLAFSDHSVQRGLHDAMKANFSLVKIYNASPRSDVQLILKRNLKLMKNEFNDVLINDGVSINEVNEQKVVILGRENSGKTALMVSLFGENFINHTKLFELQIRKKLVLMKKTDGLRFNYKEVEYNYDEDMSFKIAAKILSKKSEKMKKNEKFLKLSKAIAISGDSKTRRKGSPGRGRNRNRLKFFNVPNGEDEDDITRKSLKKKSVRANNLYNPDLQDSRFRFDSTNSDPVVKSSQQAPPPLARRTSSSFDAADSPDRLSKNEEQSENIRLSPSMRQTEIVDYFKPELIAQYGNSMESSGILLRVREISNKVTNRSGTGNAKGSTAGSGLRKVKSFGSNVTLSSGRTGKQGSKTSESDKYGLINSGLVDLNHFVYGLKSTDGIYIIVFNIRKLLKYIDLSKDKAIVSNAITKFINQNLNAIFNYSVQNTVVLAGTHYDPASVSEKELVAVNKVLLNTIRSKYLKHMLKYKTDQPDVESLCFFPVDSLSQYNIEFLRGTMTKFLTKSSKDLASESRGVPLKWLRVLDVLKIYKKENKNFISKEDLLEGVAEFGIQTMEQLDEALSFLQERGDILFFKNVEILSDIVILNKTFLYFCAYQLLNRRYMTKMLSDQVIRSKLREEDLGKDFFMFQTKKLLSRDLIEFLWRYNNHYLYKKAVSDSESYFENNKSGYLYIMEILKKGMFLSEWKNMYINSGDLPSDIDAVADVHSDHFFVVPSLFRNSLSKSTEKSNLKNVKSLKDIDVKGKDSPISSRAKAVNRLSKKRLVMSPGLKLENYEKLQQVPIDSPKYSAKNPEPPKMSGNPLAPASPTNRSPRTSFDASFVISSRGRRDSTERPTRARGVSTDMRRSMRRKASKEKGVSSSTLVSSMRSEESEDKKSTLKSLRSTNSSVVSNAASQKSQRGSKLTPKKMVSTGRNKSARLSVGRRGMSPASDRSQSQRPNQKNRASMKRGQPRGASPAKGFTPDAEILARLEHLNGTGKKTIAKLMQDMMYKIEPGKELEEPDGSASNTSPRSSVTNAHQPRFVLNRRKPVSLILDFKDSYLPHGLFIRLCSLVYDDYSESLSRHDPKIKEVELHKNFFKLVFVHDKEADEGHGETQSASGSEFDSISVVAEARRLAKAEGGNDQQYIIMYSTEEKIVCVVRNHDHAPGFLSKLSFAVETLEGVNEAESKVKGMTFFNLKLDVRVEVKNDKFIAVNEARERNLAPWFAENKMVTPRRSTLHSLRGSALTRSKRSKRSKTNSRNNRRSVGRRSLHA